MASSPLEIAEQLLLHGENAAAFAAFTKLTESEPGNWRSWLGAGLAAQYLQKLPEAAKYLERAVRLNPGDASTTAVYAAVLEKKGDGKQAKKVLARALTTNPDFAEGFKLLADWQRKDGDLRKALHNYDAGVKALARRIVKTMRNDPANPIVKHDDMRGEVWLECAMFGALWWSSEANVDGIAWPTSETAIEEERSEIHRGLYYSDETQGTATTRVFHPNYFATVRQRLRAEPIFEFLVGNQGIVHKELGAVEVAEKRFAEASLFSRRGTVHGYPA